MHEIYNKRLVHQHSYPHPGGHVTVCCKLTLQGNLGTSSVPSLPIHPSRPAGPSACDPLRPSSTATFATHDRELNLTSDLHPLLSRAFDLLLTLIGQQPAKSRAQPRPQSNAHSTPTGDLSAPRLVEDGLMSPCSVPPAQDKCEMFVYSCQEALHQLIR